MKVLIKELTEVFGPSGSEEKIRRKIIDEIKPYADSITVDRLGNIIASKAGPGERLMLAAHMDEIGIIITNIDEKGFLRFSNIGGISPFTLIGQRVVFANGTLGVIGMEKMDDIKNLKINKMFIDIGVKSKEDAFKRVNIGDTGVYDKECSIIGDHIISNSLDDRVGCAILIEVLKRLKNPNYNLFVVFTVQEEVGLRGAKTSAYGVNPDFAIAVDVTDTGDTPESEKMAVELGKGPAIKVKDSSVICHPEVKKALIDAAERKSTPFQLEVLEKGGTDTGAIHLTRSGVPSGALSIPTRYIHTPTEMVNFNDIVQSVELLIELIEGK
ncbi:putative aminopeptidase [Tepidanaerobacter acetatoxydans Re1]|uniref:Putative aminopeptidase n=1 Tax=Tepidanaerobacter acetatoxydans (strain DSM 21804 / JCM 16047 / Re1) TaxID=1209989 RepID=F4LUV6_TEPAE|nr:M42 family metallopeptidase [Tepidanaerobacter acetatoxydans]AEE91482.1 Cellulase [Tepidanaerobacter acetatoxydans Re1]CCP26191.1 putative aminopeptidase [Tepidanaerobacter acetatoxydans Re1]